MVRDEPSSSAGAQSPASTALEHAASLCPPRHSCCTSRVTASNSGPLGRVGGGLLRFGVVQQTKDQRGGSFRVALSER
eukprot:CAMPEP_0175986822 /NCGR_PEP_ID=MMETSP0108-20121206/50356_1 /TAXON_ID=195067 ORGANISM="Goniomonas pacifica, Strain CCMP1869" /NCGR_SAMPLE_ID=MMETSP0108 /ASSEMBLY_ACC=CAM_ASM_000204 /LENGTH=77 /DNA_ID=CAMNT_0017318009 /DNA_START=306 /DNA_END=536 /DNA_ORIENTATION=+